MKKFLVAVVIVVGILGVTAISAEAHVHAVTATCETGVSVNLAKYADGNTVAVSIDDRTVLTGFVGEYNATLSNPDKTVAHTWSVVVTAGDGEEWNVDEGGTIPACATPTTTTTVPPTKSSSTVVVAPVPVVAPPRTAG